MLSSSDAFPRAHTVSDAKIPDSEPTATEFQVKPRTMAYPSKNKKAKIYFTNKNQGKRTTDYSSTYLEFAGDLSHGHGDLLLKSQAHPLIWSMWMWLRRWKGSLRHLRLCLTGRYTRAHLPWVRSFGRAPTRADWGLSITVRKILHCCCSNLLRWIWQKMIKK